MAKPRVFLSSTYYDLKHVRERIERFLANFGMEPVLFESDNVTFEFNKPLDVSCYNEVKTCHMLILIVGGRYGSVVTGEQVPQEKKELYEHYVSIPRKEHETAANTGIPTFVFIDKNVYAEYQTYKKNKKIFEDKTPFNFAHVDDINVFRFISILEAITAIKTFDKVEEIENYLESQISGMLFLYLQQLQTQKQNTETLDAIAELKIISQRMNEMLSAVGKNVLKDSKEYEEVIENQDIMLLHFFKDMFYDNVVFDQERNYPLEKCNAIIDTSLDLLFSKENIEKLTISQSKESSFHKTIEQIWLDFDLDLMLSENSIKINKINLHKIMTNYIDKIYPIIEKRPEMFDKMKEIFHNDSLEAITGLPF